MRMSSWPYLDARWRDVVGDFAQSGECNMAWVKH